MEEKKMAKLYEIKEKAEHDGDAEAVAVLSWAIFKLENLVN